METRGYLLHIRIKFNNKYKLRQFKLTERFTNRNGRASQLYSQDLSKREVINIDQELELARKAYEGDEKAQDKLVEANLRFVISVAKMYTTDPVIMEELIQVGNIGLIEASKKFNPTLGFKFISFAVWYIRKEMILYLGQNSRIFRLPPHKGQLLTHVRKAQSKLIGILGRDPLLDEILDELERDEIKLAKDLDETSLKLIMDSDLKHSSLDFEMGGEDSKITLLDVIWNDSDIFDSDFSQDNRNFYLNKLFSGLSERERYVIEQNYGLGSNIFPKGFSAIADNLEVSPEIVRNIHNKAIRRLKSISRNLKIDLNEILG